MFNVLAQTLHDESRLFALLDQQFNMRDRRREHRRFPDRTEKGDAQRHDYVGD